MKVGKGEGVIICFCQIGTGILLIGKLHKTLDSLRKQINTTKRVTTDRCLSSCKNLQQKREKGLKGFIEVNGTKNSIFDVNK